MGVANPFERAQNVIDSMTDSLSNVSLRGDLFPDLKNPLDTSLVEGMSEFISNTSLPQITTGTDLLSNVNIDQVQGATPQEVKLRARGQKVFGTNDNIFG